MLKQDALCLGTKCLTKSCSETKHSHTHHSPQRTLLKSAFCLLILLLVIQPVSLVEGNECEVAAITLGVYLVCLIPGGNWEADTRGGRAGAEGQVSALHPVFPRARQAALALLRPLQLLGKAAITHTHAHSLGSAMAGKHHILADNL